MWAGPGAGTSDGWRQGVTPGYTGRPNIEVAHCTVHIFNAHENSLSWKKCTLVCFTYTCTLSSGIQTYWIEEQDTVDAVIVFVGRRWERGMLNSSLQCHILVFTADGLIHSNSRSCGQGGRGWYIGAKSGGDPPLPEYEAGPGKNLEGEGLPSNIETWEMWQLWGNWKFCQFFSPCLWMAWRTGDNTHKCLNPGIPDLLLLLSLVLLYDFSSEWYVKMFSEYNCRKLW